MAPFGNAVRLVNGYEGNVDLLEKFDVLVLGQGLRRDEQELGLPVSDILLHLLHLSLGQRGVQKMSDFVVLTVAADRIHLIFHQRDKRGDDDCRSLHHQGRKLIA